MEMSSNDQRFRPGSSQDVFIRHISVPLDVRIPQLTSIASNRSSVPTDGRISYALTDPRTHSQPLAVAFFNSLANPGDRISYFSSCHPLCSADQIAMAYQIPSSQPVAVSEQQGLRDISRPLACRQCRARKVGLLISHHDIPASADIFYR
jgi:hypothetical protein